MKIYISSYKVKKFSEIFIDAIFSRVLFFLVQILGISDMYLVSVHNMELQNLYSSPNIIRWTGHVALMVKGGMHAGF
jgi:hypothetical protein